MSKTFTDIVNNVSLEIGDTSQEMKSLIGVYVNNRYRKIIRATNWKLINMDYTISVVAGTDTYELPDDFRKELYAINKNSNEEITQLSFDLIRNQYRDSLYQSGEVMHYTVFRDEDNIKSVKFFRIPSGSITVAFPYMINVNGGLSGTDEPVNEFADLIEIGAKADSWRYKRQFQKAAAMEIIFDTELDDYMFDEENQENNGHSFSVDFEQYDRNIVG